MTLSEMLTCLNSARTSGMHASVRVTFEYVGDGVWELNLGLGITYRYEPGSSPKHPLPEFKGPYMKRLLDEMVSFFNSGTMRLYVPANSYGIDASVLLTEPIVLDTHLVVSV